MPKRTNDFQELITTIYKQIVPEGGSVTPSGEVFDREAGILREVDMLVEYKYAGHACNFIVECRDYSRYQTVEWIDGLIGKTKSLNVDKVIAVSSNGFTESAERKAKATNIETLTLREANETDWLRFPMKFGLSVMTCDAYSIHSVFYKRDEEFISVKTLGLNSDVEIEGEIAGDLKGLVEYFFQEHLVPYLEKYEKDHFFEIFKTRADVDKPLLAEIEFDWPGIYVITKEGERVELRKVKFVVIGKRKTEEVAQQHYVFNEKMVSTGKYLTTDGSVINFSIVQDPDTGKVHWRWDRKKSESDA